jgi:hypothetical protein
VLSDQYRDLLSAACLEPVQPVEQVDRKQARLLVTFVAVSAVLGLADVVVLGAAGAEAERPSSRRSVKLNSTR